MESTTQVSQPPIRPSSPHQASKPPEDQELDVALNGQEPTVKNLILAAIGVMKNRKARPDSKRISNWINRRYGRSLSEVEEELERLVHVGELARVDYKGSASFRIVQPEAKAKRRRRCPKINPQNRPQTILNNRPPLSIFAASNQDQMQLPPLTLRTLVIEMLGDSASASIESGVAFNSQFIAKSVEASHRQIYRAAVIGNLDLILAKEVEVGNFIKVGEDQYRISPLASPFNPTSLLALNPPLAHPPPAPVPVQQLMLESRNIPDSGIPPVAKISPPQPQPAQPQPPDSSDEQRKNDLIAAKLSKLEGKSKSPNKKTLQKPSVEVKKEPQTDDEDLPLTRFESEPSSPLLPKAVKKKIETNSRSGGGRKKKSRKIFDPADHEQPVRKRKAASPSLNGDSGATSASIEAPLQNGGLKPREGGCVYCGLTTAKPKKGKLEPLLSCKDCPTTVHPSCMDYSEKLIKKVLTTAVWTCSNCRTCQECQETNDDDSMIFCDNCDLAFHLSCHQPPLAERPSGKWDCRQCDNSHIKSTPEITTVKEREEENSRFLPILPPHLHPRTSCLPENWEDYDIDPEVPDVSEWEPVQIRDFFSQSGFSDTLSSVFLEQEIDGRSLLLMHRHDVVSSLGLKLGPALKLFSCIKRLQTRRNFPEN